MIQIFSRKQISDFQTSQVSLFSVWALIIIVIISQYLLKIAVSPDLNFLSWDVYGYYSYLPFNLIYHDPGMTDMNTVESIFKQYNPSSTYYQAFKLENGNWISSYAIGMSFLYLPFFLISCLYAWIFNYPVDGFSPPFQVIISMGMMIYFFIGLFFFRKLLLKYFSDKVTAITIVLLVLSTNIFHEAFNDGLEPHNVLFAFYGILMYYTDLWYRGPSVVKAMKLGAIIGFMVMIRGSEVVSFFIVLLCCVKSLSDFKLRFVFIFSHFRLYLIAVISALIIFLPQIIHWKLITGHWYFNNYKMAEGFNLLHPNLIPFFFSFKKGVFIYTPAVFIFICSLFIKKFRASGTALAIVVLLVLNTYLISSWLVWWGATSFGSRYFSQSMAVFALPFGFLVNTIMERKFILKTLFFGLFGILIFLNVFQTWQFTKCILHGERMTYDYYKAIFLKTSVPDQSWNLLEPDLEFPGSNDFPVNGKFKTHTICYYDADTFNTIYIEDKFIDSSVAFNGKNSIKLSKENIYSPAYRMPMKELTDKDYIWVGITFNYFPVSDLKKNPASLIVNMQIYGNCRDYTKYRALDLESLPYKVGEWNQATFYYLTPRLFTRNDKLVIYTYLRGEEPLFLDNFKVVAYEPL